ncbi:MAG: methyltransferase domain-containing protein [Deltaproteobacteria bacterium]|nr:methyltransferase domain-containing protein [Deltaproteobacteria bacterium]
MGIIFDIHQAKAYEKWLNSPKGLHMDLFIDHMISEIMRPFKHERVIDIGCGSGSHLLIADRHGMDITGIDASPYMLALARNRLGTRCDLKQGYAENLPYEGNEFDLAFLINTLEFLDDPLPALEEAGRVAKRGILIVFFNSMSCYIRWQKMRGIFKNSLFTGIRSYSLWEIKRALNRAYGPVQMKWRGLPLFTSPSRHSIKPLASNTSYLPIGCLIGIYVTLNYRYTTNNLYLRKKINSAKRPIIEGVHISHSK